LLYVEKIITHCKCKSVTYGVILHISIHISAIVYSSGVQLHQ